MRMKVKREGLATGTQEKSDDWRVRKKRMGKRKRRDVYFPFGSGFELGEVFKDEGWRVSSHQLVLGWDGLGSKKMGDGCEAK